MSVIVSKMARKGVMYEVADERDNTCIKLVDFIVIFRYDTFVVV